MSEPGRPYCAECGKVSGHYRTCSMYPKKKPKPKDGKDA